MEEIRILNPHTPLFLQGDSARLHVHIFTVLVRTSWKRPLQSGKFRDTCAPGVEPHISSGTCSCFTTLNSHSSLHNNMNRLEGNTTLLTLVTNMAKSIQLLKSSFKLNGAVVFKIQAPFQSRRIRAGAQRRGWGGGTRPYQADLSFLSGASTTVHHPHKSRC
ncbi:hypothetical protein CesoFtcFv8_016972 [Champsocephalus esox]|nr:hypothetical protein CesoFtcFv8_016972 [Champsocephalus esox]